MAGKHVAGTASGTPAPVPATAPAPAPAPSPSPAPAPEKKNPSPSPSTDSDSGSRFGGKFGPSDAGGAILALLTWSWVILPLLQGGPERMRNVLRAKFLNKGPKGEWLP